MKVVKKVPDNGKHARMIAAATIHGVDGTSLVSGCTAGTLNFVSGHGAYFEI